MANISIPPVPVSIPEGNWVVRIHNGVNLVASWTNPVQGPTSVTVTGTYSPNSYISYEDSALFPDPTVSPHF